MTAPAEAKHTSYTKLLLPVLLVAVLLGSFFVGLPLLLNNPTPLRVVESGSMCVLYGRACDDFLSVTHEFTATLHKGDIIIIQGVDPETINADYPNSDIIVYQRPDLPLNATPVVHRVVTVTEENGVLYFQTKGDGNGTPYPAYPSQAEYDSNNLWRTSKGVPEDRVLGKVVMRIPYLGWITLFLQENSWGLPLIIGVILLLLALEFILPELKKRKQQPPQTSTEANLTDFSG